MKKKPATSEAPANPRLRMLAMYRALGMSIREAAALAGYASTQSAAAALSSSTGRAELERITAEIERRYVDAAITGDLARVGLLPPVCSKCESCRNYSPRNPDTSADPSA